MSTDVEHGQIIEDEASRLSPRPESRSRGQRLYGHGENFGLEASLTSRLNIHVNVPLDPNIISQTVSLGNQVHSYWQPNKKLPKNIFPTQHVPYKEHRNWS